MSKLAEEFHDVLGLYVKLTADLTRIAGVGESEDNPQAIIQSILDNRSCLTEIQQLNARLSQLYGAWKDEEANLSDGDEIRGVVDGVREQMRQLEKLCGIGAGKIEKRRRQLAEELANAGKESSYVKMLNPIKENYPKFIDSAC